MIFSKSTMIFRKDWFKNIINCLKINLSKILGVTGKMLAARQLSLEILDFFLKPGLTYTLQETLQ